MKGCLDTWAVIGWSREEECAAAVSRCLVDGAVMSWISVGEVEYITSRKSGAERAAQLVESISRNVVLDLATPERVREAAALKAVHRMSYADCFAVATAVAHRLPLLTGDPEIVAVKVPGLRVVDLR